jgi:hypothetical protein
MIAAFLGPVAVRRNICKYITFPFIRDFRLVTGGSLTKLLAYEKHSKKQGCFPLKFRRLCWRNAMQCMLTQALSRKCFMI